MDSEKKTKNIKIILVMVICLLSMAANIYNFSRYFSILSFNKEIFLPEVKLVADYAYYRNDKLPKIICNAIGRETIKQSKKQGIPVELLIGIIASQSIFDPTYISEAGKRGLMRVCGYGDIQVDRNNIHNIDYNISKGIEILKAKLKKNGGDITNGLLLYTGNEELVSNIKEEIGKFIIYKFGVNKNYQFNEKKNSGNKQG